MSYKNTDRQIQAELGAMHQKMRDPVLHEKKILENKTKKNVERTIKRYGLG